MKNFFMAAMSVFVVLWCGFSTSCNSVSFKSRTEYLDFSGNPAAGYRWNVIHQDYNNVITVEEIEFFQNHTSDQNQSLAYRIPSLCSYKIKSVKPGNTKLSFCYSRPWDYNGGLSETVDYLITVTETGKILFKDCSQS